MGSDAPGPDVPGLEVSVASSVPVGSDVVVAVDVGGTMIKAALLAAPTPGRTAVPVRHVRRYPTGAGRGAQAVVATILRVVADLLATARAEELPVRAVGLAVPGVVDEAAGVAVWSANLALRDVALRAQVVAHAGLPTVLCHDVRAGGVAEARIGAGQQARHVLFVAVGTGIAAAHVVGGQPRPGAHGAAGELGHVVVRPGGAPCACGGRGCLETIASAAGIQRRYAELSGAGAVTAEQVAAAVAGGEAPGGTAGGTATAVRVWREAIDALADGLVIAQALLDVEVIVVGGGLAQAGDTLLVPLRAVVTQQLTVPRMPALVAAALGDLAGCLGAGLLALDTT